MLRRTLLLAWVFSLLWFIFSLMALQLGRPYPDFFHLLLLDNPVNQLLSVFLSLTLGFLCFMLYRLQPKPYRLA